MLEYLKLLVELYKKELQEDRELWHGLIQEWIIIPRDTTMYTYMAMYGVFGCAIKIVILLLVRIPLWWPLHMMAYIINCTVRYTFVPVFAFLHLQLNKAETSNNIVYAKGYGYLLTFIQRVEWILKTVFLLTYTVDKIVTWVHNRRSVRGYIDYKIDQIVVKAHTLRNEKQKQGRVRKAWVVVTRVWATYITPVPRIILQGIKFLIKYINPLNYTWVKYLVYSKNRENLIVILKCRVIIRYALLKGLVKYGAQGWLYFRLRRWVRLTVHLFKVIRIKYHPQLILLNIKHWVAFHCWWTAYIVYKHVGHCYIYLVWGLKWLLLCVAVISSPILYILLYLLYLINALNLWITHGLWVSRSNFYLMLGFNPKLRFWKWHTRIK